jgi:hypothetical protein
MAEMATTSRSRKVFWNRSWLIAGGVMGYEVRGSKCEVEDNQVERIGDRAFACSAGSTGSILSISVICTCGFKGPKSGKIGEPLSNHPG